MSPVEQAVAYQVDCEKALSLTTRGRALVVSDPWLATLPSDGIVSVVRVIRIVGPAHWVRQMIEHSVVAPGVPYTVNGACVIEEPIRLVEAVGGSR
jgi:hypothetical protein